MLAVAAATWVLAFQIASPSDDVQELICLQQKNTNTVKSQQSFSKQHQMHNDWLQGVSVSDTKQHVLSSVWTNTLETQNRSTERHRHHNAQKQLD